MIDPSKGALMLVEHAQTGGIMPRSFAIDPTGKFLLAAKEVSNNLVFFVWMKIPASPQRPAKKS